MHKIRINVFTFLERLGSRGRFLKKLSELFKISYISAESFLMDACLTHASALAYKTLLSLVPFIAIVFAILKGFGVQYSIREQLLKTITGNLTEIVDHLIILIDNVNAGALGIIGLSFLLVTVFSLLSFVEKAFNNIWGIKTNRNFARKVTDYFSIVFLAPFFAALSISLNSFLKIEPRFEWLQFLPVLTQIILPFTPFLTASAACFVLYMFMPNSKIRWQAALGGGIIGGGCWIILQMFYLTFSGYMHNLNAIYQGFAQIPLFFLWVYCTWVIVLYGAEVSFAIQNRHTYLVELYSKNPSLAARIIISVLLIHEASNNQEKNRGPLFMVEEVANKYRLSIRLLHSTANVLTNAGLTKKIYDASEDNRYYLFTEDVNQLTFERLITKLLFSSEDREEVLWKNISEIAFISEVKKHIDSMIEGDSLRVLDIKKTT